MIFKGSFQTKSFCDSMKTKSKNSEYSMILYYDSIQSKI